MGKSLFIAEKPSVANEFAKALKEDYTKRDGYMESANTVVTWCVGHLVTMSYPEVYDAALAKWSLDTIPFLPSEFKYEVIPGVAKQFNIVKGLLNRADITSIYVCTDSGREGEYIYRLVDRMAQVPDTKDKRRVWIDSQTEEEVLRGIREAKPLSAYEHLSDAAYLRAKEDYLMGINFSRVLTLKYGYPVRSFLQLEKGGAISVGRVMTCVLGMVVRREREIRAFTKTPFYRVIAGLQLDGTPIPGEFKAVEGSRYFNTPFMYKENGFKELETAKTMISHVLGEDGSDRVYKHVIVATEHVKPFRNDDVRLFILHHELGHCCDDRTVAGQDLMQLAYEHTHGKKPEEVISFVEEHNRRTGLAGEYFADEFAAQYLGCRKAFKALRTLHRASKVMVECLKLEYTEEMQQPVKDRMRNIFRRRKELRAARKAKLLLTLEELAALSERQGAQAA